MNRGINRRDFLITGSTALFGLPQVLVGEASMKPRFTAYIDPRDVRVQHDDRRLTVSTPFWSVTHALDRGGAPVEINFVHGRLENILAAPLALQLDDLSDVTSPRIQVAVREMEDGLEVVFEGRLGNARGEPSNVSFQTRYHYTPYWVGREVRLELPDGLRARRLCLLGVRLDAGLTHWAARFDPSSRPGRQVEGKTGDRAGVVLEDTHPIHSMSVYRLGGEGLQVAPMGDLRDWDGPAGVPGRGSYRLEMVDGSPAVFLDALQEREGAVLPGKLAFGAFLTLANLRALRPLPLRMVQVGNPPFPSEELLKAWAQSGVEVVVLMEGATWGNVREKPEPSPAGPFLNRFWRTGSYPCYRDKADMQDLDRMIRTCHVHGMRIVAYANPALLHPETAVFAENIQNWFWTRFPQAGVEYQPKGGGPEVYGALVCSAAPGWQRYFLDHVRTVLANHDFDGLYVDMAGTVNCYNPEHGPAHHRGGWEILGRLRRFLGPDKIMIFHNSDSYFEAISNNLAEGMVTLEATPRMEEGEVPFPRYDLEKIARPLQAFPACGAAMVPSSSWYRIRPPLPPQAGLYEGIARGLLVGAIPYSETWEESRRIYSDAWEALHDPRGLYALYQRLASLKLASLQFEDCFSNAVRTNRQGVLGARFFGKGRQIVLVANVSGREVTDIRWQCDQSRGDIDRLSAGEYRLIDSPS